MKKKNNNTDKKLTSCGENHISKEFIKKIRTLNFALFNKVINYTQSIIEDVKSVKIFKYSAKRLHLKPLISRN